MKVFDLIDVMPSDQRFIVYEDCNHVLLDTSLILLQITNPDSWLKILEYYKKYNVIEVRTALRKDNDGIKRNKIIIKAKKVRK